MLQWRPRLVPLATSGVCAQSEIASTCISAVTHEEAAGVCAGVGARLCHASELHADIARETGCGFDFAASVWTADKCGSSASSAWLLAPGSTKGGSRSADMCAPADAGPFGYPVRCCADDHREASAPTANGFAEIGPGSCRGVDGNDAANSGVVEEATFEECEAGCAAVASCTGFEWKVDRKTQLSKCISFSTAITHAWAGNGVDRCFVQTSTFSCNRNGAIAANNAGEPFSSETFGEGSVCDDGNSATIVDTCQADGTCSGTERVDNTGLETDAEPAPEVVQSVVDVVVDAIVGGDDGSGRTELVAAASSVGGELAGTCADSADVLAQESQRHLDALTATGVNADEILLIDTACEDVAAAEAATERSRRGTVAKYAHNVIFFTTPSVVEELKESAAAATEDAGKSESGIASFVATVFSLAAAVDLTQEDTVVAKELAESVKAVVNFFEEKEAENQGSEDAGESIDLVGDLLPFLSGRLTTTPTAATSPATTVGSPPTTTACDALDYFGDVVLNTKRPGTDTPFKIVNPCLHVSTCAEQCNMEAENCNYFFYRGGKNNVCKMYTNAADSTKNIADDTAAYYERTSNSCPSSGSGQLQNTAPADDRDQPARVRRTIMGARSRLARLREARLAKP